MVASLGLIIVDGIMRIVVFGKVPHDKGWSVHMDGYHNLHN